MQCDYDVLIIGGGLVGASLACALGVTQLRVAVVEAQTLGSPEQASYDDRTVALAYGSRRIFEGMGLWQEIVDLGAYPIEHIHISDRGHFGITHLHASDAGLEALGYVAATRALGQALYRRLPELDNVELLCPATVDSVEVTPEAASCQLHENGEQRRVTTRLLVLADGGRSGVAQQLGMHSKTLDYGQTAIVSNVTPGRAHAATAYERFTANGPLALLPMDAERCAVVWSVTQEAAPAMLELTDSEFLERLQEYFGMRLGRFTRVGRRQLYPLSMIRPQETVRPRLVLIGNAAHTVHPVAGQGFNLGLRDVASLAQVIVDHTAMGEDPGTLSVLRGYANWRQHDNSAITIFTHSLIRIFSNNFVPLVLARNLGLLGVEVLPGLKRAFTRRTSGLQGRLPRLARGLPLVLP